MFKEAACEQRKKSLCKLEAKCEKQKNETKKEAKTTKKDSGGLIAFAITILVGCSVYAILFIFVGSGYKKCCCKV